MTSLAAKVVGGAAVTSFGCLAYWVQKKADHVDPEQRGSLLLRIGETIRAAINSGSIADKEVTEKHLDLVASLSSKSYAETISTSKDQRNTLAVSYPPGHVIVGTSNDKITSTPTSRDYFVFRYGEKFPGLPPMFGYKNFVFAGPASKLHDIEAREDILRGNYTRCTPSRGSNKRTVVVTGTTDNAKCSDFQIDLVRHAALNAHNMDGITLAGVERAIF